ncbi:hypothetical protein [Actinomadura montaniterrae]|uniref:hypothetical protein n=1 Tax=Actinomadura montaniterrae TaxID=1803903 RepID=UPI00178C2C2A|nr:hypothetical protein [Actinomadura montaniterrae]
MTSKGKGTASKPAKGIFAAAAVMTAVVLVRWLGRRSNTQVHRVVLPPTKDA